MARRRRDLSGDVAAEGFVIPPGTGTVHGRSVGSRRTLSDDVVADSVRAQRRAWFERVASEQTDGGISFKILRYLLLVEIIEARGDACRLGETAGLTDARNRIVYGDVIHFLRGQLGVGYVAQPPAHVSPLAALQWIREHQERAIIQAPSRARDVDGSDGFAILDGRAIDWGDLNEEDDYSNEDVVVEITPVGFVDDEESVPISKPKGKAKTKKTKSPVVEKPVPLTRRQRLRGVKR